MSEIFNCIRLEGRDRYKWRMTKLRRNGLMKEHKRKERARTPFEAWILDEYRTEEEIIRRVKQEITDAVNESRSALQSPRATTATEDADSVAKFAQALGMDCHARPENIKWLLDAANQVISELGKQEHLDSDTFRWLCNAVGQIERDLRKQPNESSP